MNFKDQFDKLPEEIIIPGLVNDQDKIEERTKKNELLDFSLIELKIDKEETGFNGDIVYDNKRIGHFSIRFYEPGLGYVSDIQIGYDENAPRGKGMGTEVYKKIIKHLNEEGVKLVSTNWEISQTSISPQALRVWKKLEEAGYAIKRGEVEGKIHDRFTGEDRVDKIPTYKSAL